MGVTLHDNRKYGRETVWKLTADQLTWAAAVATEDTETAYNMDGTVRTVVLRASNATNAITFTLSLRDGNGATLFTQAAIDKNAKTVISEIDVAFQGSLVIGVTPSGVPGAGGATMDVEVCGD